MIAVRVRWGLANQMFQYAFALSLAKSGFDVRVVTKFQGSQWDHEHIRCDEVFDLGQFKELRHHELPCRYFTHSRFSKPLRQIWSRLGRPIPNCFVTEFVPSFDQTTFAPQDGQYLEGLWAREDHLLPIRKDVAELFTFPALTDPRNIELAERIRSHGNVVSVHVRRGPDYENVTSLDFYERAITQMRDTCGDIHVIVFSDNPTWSREHLGSMADEFISWNPVSGPGNHIDMQIMSLCDHHIIANSTYSWWGAWLNEQPTTVVIAPDGRRPLNLYPDRWIVI